MIKVPMFQVYTFSESISIDSRTYTLTFTWNHRAKYWSVHVDDSTGARVASGLRLMLEFDLLRRYSKTELPRGQFIAIRDGSEKIDITFDETAKSLHLLYVTEAEYAAL